MELWSMAYFEKTHEPTQVFWSVYSGVNQTLQEHTFYYNYSFMVTDNKQAKNNKLQYILWNFKETGRLTLNDMPMM